MLLDHCFYWIFDYRSSSVIIPWNIHVIWKTQVFHPLTCTSFWVGQTKLSRLHLWKGSNCGLDYWICKPMSGQSTSSATSCGNASFLFSFTLISQSEASPVKVMASGSWTCMLVAFNYCFSFNVLICSDSISWALFPMSVINHSGCGSVYGRLLHIVCKMGSIICSRSSSCLRLITGLSQNIGETQYSLVPHNFLVFLVGFCFLHSMLWYAISVAFDGLACVCLNFLSSDNRSVLTNCALVALNQDVSLSRLTVPKDGGHPPIPTINCCTSFHSFYYLGHWKVVK